MDKYRPPDSDSDESYEGFYFGDEDVKPARPIWKADSQQNLYDAVTNGDINTVVGHVSSHQEHINDPIRGGSTLLHHGCKHGHIDIVVYLLSNGANPNRQIDSITPLMEACGCLKDSKTAKEICAMLIDQGAVINVSDKYGQTPFMFACIRGHLDVVDLIIKSSFLEASDNQGWTPLFHAIENNHPEIVRRLVEAGAEVNVSNRKGYLPRQVAQFHGFYDILNILPPEVHQYMVPTNYLTYSSLRDFIPRLFLKSDVPEYFQEIDTILRKMDMKQFLVNFAQNRVNFGQFLTMTDDKLAEIDIKLPLHRKKILLGLTLFHLEHWSTKSIGRVKRKENDSFYDILMLASNHLKNVVIVSSAIRFIEQNIESNRLGKIKIETIHKCQEAIKEYQNSIVQLKKTTQYLQSFSPTKPPLYINFDDYVVEQKQKNTSRFLKYAIIAGVVLVALIKLNRV